MPVIFFFYIFNRNYFGRLSVRRAIIGDHRHRGLKTFESKHRGEAGKSRPCDSGGRKRFPEC